MAFSSELPSRAKMLWAHVLRRAVFDYVLYKGVGKYKLDWQRAYRYIFTPGREYSNGLSFEEVCDVFGWNPDYVRRLAVQLNRSDIKRMETEALKEEFSQGLLESCVKGMLRWRSVQSTLPLYPRMVDEYNSMPETKVVQRETLSRPVPLVRWHAIA